ncbi:hypothetical protein ACIQWV_40110, partial [Streptomyces sp. NPDC098085]
MTAEQWRQRLSDLIAGNHSIMGDPVDAGARLIVSDPDGTEVFRAALARHYRFEDNGEQILWIRPLVGGADTESGYLGGFNRSSQHLVNGGVGGCVVSRQRIERCVRS